MTVWEFFLQIAGFAPQTVPVAMLMCVPFNDGELRYSRGKTNGVLIALVIAASAGFVFAEPAMPDESKVPLANLYMIVFIFIVFGVYFYFVRSKILNRLLVMVILIHYAAILFTCSNILTRLPFMPGKTEERLIYSVNSALSFLIVTVVTFPLVYVFMKRVVRPAISINDSKTMKRGFIYFMSALAMYCAASAFFDFYFGRDIYNKLGVMIFFATLVFTDFIMYFMFFSEIKLVTRNNLLENRIRSLNEQYRRISRGIEESRRLKHDMRHHLNAISTMARNGETKELLEYLEAYSAVYGELSDLALCGYHALDNTLRYYISLAKERGIDIQTKFRKLSPDMDFDVTDMTVLIGNIMENAIEACEKLSDRERFISISIKQTDASLLIKAENSCPTSSGAQTSFTGSESFISTKHTRQPGQGLRSISLVAEKYGGVAEFKCENGVFTARTVLNIP